MSNSISNVSVKFSISCMIFMEITQESCFLLFFSISKIGHVFMNMSISHVNPAYLDLCKFTFFDEPLQRGLISIHFNINVRAKNTKNISRI